MWLKTKMFGAFIWAKISEFPDIFTKWLKNVSSAVIFHTKNHRFPLTPTPPVASNGGMVIVLTDAVSGSTFGEGSVSTYPDILPFPFTQQ